MVRPDDRVGNALLTLPLVRALQAALPGAQVDLLLPAGRGAALSGLPGITLIPFEKQAFFRAPRRFLSALLALRRAGYDAAIDASHWHSYSLTAALLTRVATRRWAVGGSHFQDALHSVTVGAPPPWLNEVEGKLLLLAGLGLAPPDRAPPLETALGLAPRARQFVEGALEAHPLARFAALNIGARKPDHRWAPGKFAALARGLRERHGLVSLVLWGPGEEELARAVVEGAGGAAVLAPPSDLEQLAGAFRSAALVATNDTGPLHLAVACGAKVVALQLAADGARWGHRGAEFEAVPVHAANDDSLQGSPPGAPPEEIAAALEAAGRLLALTAPPKQATVSPAKQPFGAAHEEKEGA